MHSAGSAQPYADKHCCEAETACHLFHTSAASLVHSNDIDASLRSNHRAAAAGMHRNAASAERPLAIPYSLQIDRRLCRQSDPAPEHYSAAAPHCEATAGDCCLTGRRAERGTG